MYSVRKKKGAEPPYKPFNEIGTPLEIIKQVFGGKKQYQQALVELEEQLYLNSLDSVDSLEKSA